MRYAEFAPAPDIQPFAERYWLLEGAAAEGGGPILPDGHPELVLHFAARPLRNGQRQSSNLLVGQMRTATSLALDGPMNAWGIRFHPHTARAVAGDSIPTDIVNFPDASALREALGNARTVAERIALCDGWLRTRTAGRRTPALVGEAIRLLPSLSVEETAARLNCSRRHLGRAFTADVGLPPKAWTRIVRLQAAIRLRDRYPDWTWAAVAAEAGYADQPHLALDFRAIAGAAPSQLEAAILSHSCRAHTPGSR